MNRSIDRRSVGHPPRQGAGEHAFTLIETILVLAVITLLGTLLLPGVNSILKTINQEEPDRLFWDAVNLAREQALTTDRIVTLRVDDNEKLLIWGDGTNARQQKLPAGVGLKFLQPRQGSAILLGGMLLETEELSLVRFYPDGTCDRFRAQIIRGKTAPQIIAVDPWTCAPMFGSDQ